MKRPIQLTAYACKCNICGYEWVSNTDPQCCQNRKCRSKLWDGRKKRSHVKEIRLPAPRKRGRPRTVALLSGRDHGISTESEND